MLRVEIQTFGLTPKQFVLKTISFINAITIEMNGLGENTVKAMKKVIKQERKRGPSRSGNRLANSIKGYSANLTLASMYGVGKVSHMNAVAPYWKVVNYGGIVPPMTYGSFGTGSPPDSALTGKGSEPWNEVTGGTAIYHFRMKPTTEIRPMHFIQITNSNIASRWMPFWRLKLLAIWMTLPTPPPVP